MTTLFVNACAHDASRTLSLCRAYLEGNPAVEEVRLFERNLAPFDWKMVEQRVALIEKADWGDSMFDLAKQFAAADEIVIGTPYWDLSFPAVLKIYIEHVTSMASCSTTPKREGPKDFAKRSALCISPRQVVLARSRTTGSNTFRASRTCSASLRRTSSPPNCSM